jgi:hypothetical protein
MQRISECFASFDLVISTDPSPVAIVSGENDLTAIRSIAAYGSIDDSV